jgi:uncharacterized protein (DUF58 family)
VKVVPQQRLIWITAAIALPAGTIAGALPELAGLAVGSLAALGLVAAWDAWRGWLRLGGLAITAPETARLSAGRPGMLRLTVNAARCQQRRLRIGLETSPDLRPDPAEQIVRLPADAALARIEWPVSAVRRGIHRVPRAHVEGASPLGLWSARLAVDVGAEVRVYPDLLKERRAVAALFLSRGATGVHAQRQVGQGRDFEQLREYLPGDGLDDIHWKATARRRVPITKVHQLERTQEVYVVIDASRLSARPVPLTGEGDSDEPQLERSLRSALLLAAAAERQGDLFGVIAFDRQVRAFVRSGNGRGHYGACREALHALESVDASPDFEEIATFLRLRLRRRALLVFITALDDPVLAEGFQRAAALLGRQHLLLVLMARPAPARPVFEGSAPVGTLDDIHAALGGHMRWQQLRSLELDLRRHGVHFRVIESEHLASAAVTEYVNLKRRQLL